VLEKAVKKGWWEGDPKKALSLPSLDLSAPIETVQKVLVKVLKPNRKTVSVIKIKDGKIEEITEATYVEKKDEAEAATTVAVPTRGCPAPTFEAAELKANRVLKVFLTPDQVADFDRHNAFVTVGADTGHRYALTSRHATGLLAKRRRTLYDLDENVPYCVHDWTVPAAEELLALHAFLSLPGRETFLRGVPEGVVAEAFLDGAIEPIR